MCRNTGHSVSGPRTKPIPIRSAVVIIATLLIASGPPASAAEADAGRPIEIEADSMTLNEADGTTQYRGGVRLTQGTIEVQAERLTLHSKNGRLSRMEMIGSDDQPALFQQQTDSGGLARGRAQRIEYNAGDTHLILNGRAELRQGPNHIRSEQIHYNTRTNSLRAGDKGPTGQGDSHERVQITIQSEQEE